MTRPANLIRTLAVVILMALFVLPLLGHLITADDEVSAVENRQLQSRPAWTGNWVNFQQSSDRYLNDQFGFRSVGIHINNRLTLKFEGELPLVILGQDDWLFLAEAKIWESYQGKNFDAVKVENWLDKLALLKSDIEKTGAAFYAMVPPNKARIYPEYAPYKYGAPAEHFQAELLKHDRASSLHLLDVMQPILAEKPNGPVYYRTDTHWTLQGAFQAYKTLLEAYTATGATVPVLTQNQLITKKTKAREGDLFRLFAKPGFAPESLNSFDVPPTKGFRPRKFDKKSSAPVGYQPKIFERKKPKTTLVIIGDSFSDRLIPLFKHSFDKIVLVHHQEGEFTLDDVTKHAPDLVLFAPVERFGETLSIFPK